MSAWYRSLSPLKVDVVGDFAGKELFAIHGDSMLLHCIVEGKVDYEGTSFHFMSGPLSKQKTARIPLQAYSSQPL